MTPELEIQIKQVIEFWNSCKQNSKWKSSRNSPAAQYAIKQHLKVWPVEDLITAIKNYAWVFYSKETIWTYSGWGIVEFFNRRAKDDHKAFQWWRFVDGFCEEDWLTDGAKHKRVLAEKQQARKSLDGLPEVGKPVDKPYKVLDGRKTKALLANE